MFTAVREVNRPSGPGKLPREFESASAGILTECHGLVNTRKHSHSEPMGKAVHSAERFMEKRRFFEELSAMFSNNLVSHCSDFLNLAFHHIARS